MPQRNLETKWEKPKTNLSLEDQTRKTASIFAENTENQMEIKGKPAKRKAQTAKDDLKNNKNRKSQRSHRYNVSESQICGNYSGIIVTNVQANWNLLSALATMLLAREKRNKTLLHRSRQFATVNYENIK